ncbi:hypothetical protein M407DRAFT_18730 [Tulasnella calospora MUT 4182]|uniref:Protein kinase domain-containing protein n=1 Tax=Tulasnella calospora MUT 4182 TaxID=1051891 RepID=A0A0C3MFC1_9AGAM|nr:hypothetical protein M407DRAFT_18730 [Tulasnella calospora MUT 4182]
MADHIIDQQKKDQPPPTVAARPQAVRISSREVLESLSALRIEITRIIPLETEDWKRGASADVIPAVLTPDGASEPPNFAHAQHVAVKKLRLDCDTEDARVLALLAHEMYLLNNLSHNNIIRIIGFVEDAKDGIAWIVLPWEENGNLREFVASADWEFPERIALIHDVTKGIDYLHNRESPISHGDLKSAEQLNVLVNSNNVAVITDFGSARSLQFASGGVPQSRAPSTEAASHLNTGSPKVELLSCWLEAFPTWRAISGLSAGSVGRRVMTSNFPFAGENDASVVLQIVEGKHPLLHGDGRLQQVVALANLMVDCWNLHPSKRPTAKSCERQVYWMDRARPCRRSGSEFPELRSTELLSSIAFMHMKHSRLDEAMDLILRCMNIARSTEDEQAGADALHTLGEIYRLRGEYSKAEESYVTARDIYGQVEDQLGLANAVNGLGEVYRLRGEYSNAEKSYIEARDIYTNLGDELGLSNVVKALGDVYRLRGEYSKASESYVTARDIYARIGNQAGLASLAEALGDVYQSRGEYPEAEKSYLDARDIYRSIGNQSGLANAVSALGDVYRFQGGYSKAKEFYLCARNIYTRIGNRIGVANAIKALGDVYSLRGEYSKAEESYITAWSTYNDVGDLGGLATTAQALGDIHRMRGEYSKAEGLYISTREIYAGVGYSGGLANTNKALGDVYRLRGKYSKAEESYATARDIYTRIGDQIGLANTLTGMGQLFVKHNDPAKAEQSYQEAREIYAKIGQKPSLANNLWSTGWMYRSQKRYEEAEIVVSEASTLFRELGLEKERSECDGFLKAVRKEKPQKWKRVFKARLSRLTHGA